MTIHKVEGGEQVRQALVEACKFGGGQTRWAQANGFSLSYVNAMTRGHTNISHEVAAMVGYERVLVFRPMLVETRKKERTS